MNSQIPYLGALNQGNLNYNMPNLTDTMYERLNNKINRLERQIKIIENRLNRMEGGNPTFLKNNLDDNDNMYML